MRSHRWTLKAEQDGSRTLVTQLGWLHAGPADVYASETASVSRCHNSGVFRGSRCSTSLPTAVLERTHSWRNGAPPSFEESRDDRPVNEPADMGRIRHPTARGGAAVHLMH